MEITQFVGLAGIPVIIALVAICRPFISDSRFYPLLSVAWGILLNILLAVLLKADIPTGVLVGIIAGLGASGLYDTGRSAMQMISSNPAR